MRALIVLIAILAAQFGFVESVRAQLSPEWKLCGGKPFATPDQVIQSCTDIIKRGTESSENLAGAYYNRGAAYFDKAQLDRALDDFDQAIRLKPKFSVAFGERALVYVAKGQRERALQDYNQAILLDPTNPIYYFNRGTSLLALGKQDESIVDFNEAIRLKPDFGVAFSNRGNAYAEKGQFSKAVEDFSEAILLNPVNALAIVNRGRAYLKLAEFDRAITDLETGLKLDPSLGPWTTYELAQARAAKTALASRATSATRRVAMVVGNGQYPYIGNLKNAENDSVQIAAALKANGYEIIGPDGTNAPFNNLTKPQFEAALDEFQKQAETAEVALIWYAGHGSSFQVGDQQKDNFLLPIDFRSNDAKDILVKGISVERMKRAVIPSSRMRLIIIDACRDNNVEVPTRGLKRGLLAEARNNEMIIMFSTKAGEQAEDGDGDLSPFAQGFLDELKENPKAAITTFLVGVTGRVKTATKLQQVPEVFSNVSDPKLTLVK
jgi:tetratricopeptide (TPR) repeat protein